MKRSNKNLVSIVTAVALTTTLILNGTYSKVNAKEVSNEKLKETIVNQMKDYMKNNSKNTKGEKINSKDEEKKSQDEVVRVIVQIRIRYHFLQIVMMFKIMFYQNYIY